MSFRKQPSLKGMEPRTAQYLEQRHKEEAFFQQAGAVLIIDGAPIIKAKVQEYEKALEDYNKKLMEQFRLRIRPKQTTTIRGRKYIYLGRYMYIRSGINTMTDLEIIEEPKTSQGSPKGKPSKAKKSGKGKVENDTLPITNLEKMTPIDPNLTEHYTPSGAPKSLDYNDLNKSGWDYVGKVDQVLESPDFKHVFVKVGYPPVPSIKNLRYSIVISKGEESDHVILPSTLFMKSEVNPLFSGLTYIPIA
jgi:hypothetical protein